MSPRAVLVTGGAGYVGSVLVDDLLRRGRSVRVLDALSVGDGHSLLQAWGGPGFEFVRGDVREPGVRAAALADVDAVVHLAAVVGDPACARDPERAREVNLGATVDLVNEAAGAGVRRFVFASTCSNYGKMQDGNVLATEEWELRPVSLYAETKVAAELEVLAGSTGELATTCLRFATVYGTSPRMRFDLTVNEFARDAFLNHELVVYGEQFWRPYVHVRDAVTAISAVLEAPAESVQGEVFNVGNSRENYRKQDLIGFLLDRIPETVVERVAQADDPRDYRVGFDKIESQLGFATNRTVPGGIDELVALLRSGAISDPFADVYRN
ncbi:MAG: SDR family oxidoreductase [Actinomycetota bacterium]|nr:SDR family oxidoreductase [Actinomycetota bacterium]